MPILPAEVALFPEGLLDGPLEPGARRWWVVYTKARQEKALARELFRRQIPFYLPLFEKGQLRRGRRVSSRVPMFAGYVFLYGSEEERVRALATNRVSRILPVDDQAQLQQDLAQVRRLIESKLPLSIESRLLPGDRVRIRAGSFAGLEGVVDARRGGHRLIVIVHFLQQGVSVEVDDLQLESIGSWQPRALVPAE